ncbi:MAG TPA: glycosyltransferase family 4 protein [Puia sp.]
MKKILLISHDDTRTGAPILLINIAEAIKSESPQTEVRFLIKNYSGQVMDGFKKAGTVFAAKNKNKLSRKLNRSEFSKKNIRKALEDIDFVISNTITNGDLLPVIRIYYKGPIVSYIHELQMGSLFFTSQQNLLALIKNTDHYLAPSKAVKNFLIDDLAVPEEKIDILPYYIHLEKSSQHAQINADEHKPFVVGAAGTIDWRKGPDIFIGVAIQVFKKMPEADIKFFWIGANEGVELTRLLYDVQKAGLENKVNFAFVTDDLKDFYASIDLFALTSREDPYPLVVLLAANVSVPSLCFDASGGISEFINDDAGMTINYLDITAMAEAVLLLYRDRQLLQKKGSWAKEKVERMHNNSSEMWRQLENIFQKVSDKKDHQPNKNN